MSTTIFFGFQMFSPGTVPVVVAAVPVEAPAPVAPLVAPGRVALEAAEPTPRPQRMEP